MKHIWYKNKKHLWGWTPVSVEGWFVSFLYVVTLILFFIDSDRYSHSVSDTFTSFAPFFVAVSVLYLFIGHHTSDRT